MFENRNFDIGPFGLKFLEEVSIQDKQKIISSKISTFKKI